MMRNQFSTLRQTHGIDTVRFEHDNSKVRADRHNHQRQEQTVSTGQLGYQEDSGQRGMHDARHQSRHSHQGKVLFRNVCTSQLELIAHIREHKAGNTSQEQARCKNTTATATTVGRTRCEDLKQDNQQQIHHQQLRVPVEKRVIHYRIPFGIRPSIEQQGNGIITFTIQRREQKNQYTQHGSSNQELHIRITITAENILNPVHGTGKIPGHQPTENAQCNGVWNTFQRERIIQVKLEHGFRTSEQIRNRSCRHTGNQQGKQRSHGQVNHQYLQRKDHTGNRCLEDTRNRPGSSTSHQQHQRLVVHTENTAQVRTNGRTGQHNRRFGTDRSTTTDGNGRSKNGRPYIMPLDTALLTRNGIQNFGHTMTDVVTHHFSNEQSGQEDTYHRIHQVQPVYSCRIKVFCQELLDILYQELQQTSGQRRADSH